MYDEEAYWIWLCQALGYGNYKVKAVLRAYDDIKKFYESGTSEWKFCGFFTLKEISSLQNHNLDEAQKTLERSKKLGQKVIAISNPLYPARLREIFNPPCVLYIKGELPKIDDKICIAIVGTRSATPYGKEVSFKLSHDLAKKGAIVISGGALGVDCVAHKGALQGGGETLLILGCGINSRYLMENSSLRYEISQNGALISEYPPDCPAWPRYFPLRNRIISGLSVGVVIVEAGEKSGSLITANLALEQDKDVFAVPGNVQSQVSRGTNLLIQAGAKPVLCAEDIWEEYDNLTNKPEKSYRIEKSMISKLLDFSEDYPKIPENISNEASLILNSLKETQKHLDDICDETALSIGSALKAITELEIHGLICSFPGKRYAKIGTKF
ncbi:MAG: DNA-processing protein DprA [Oscillospiraceae bacterium]|jgi:DNA processing protein|nr:DNA-processing protein DprA [Oscillospiraceae bacterium]